ncbi:MAG TPA: helicase C-terminal domain-containing protein [Paucimonas sp.]|nr:helicase C-terminal domain-containing protein [Paucimonas sp.]
MKYVVAVRALCEFTAKRGDLDLRFTPSPSAQEGIAGHAVVAARRKTGYQTEIALSGEYRQLTVRGRADGYDPERNRLEEIKTYRGKLDGMPDNHRHLHWAQAKIYGWLQCRRLGLSGIELALVYFDIGSQRETVFAETHSAEALQLHFEEHCERFLAWAEQELAHRAARDRALKGLRFPHAEFRPGQRALAEAVYKGTASGRCLLAQAPTGIGKTVGTLFPVLKACPSQQLDKVFFLAAKTSGRGLALDALKTIRRGAAPLPLRILELVARDKACEHPDKACHGESCPLARGFYDRLPAARAAALRIELLDQAAVRETALAHDVCPYYLSQDLARWSDVVVGDYNYFFDLSAMLHGLTIANEWRVATLVDEAHNLVERGRKMYSAELDQAAFLNLRRNVPQALAKAFARIHRAWNALLKEQAGPYRIHEAPPHKLLAALQGAAGEMTEYMAEHPAAVSADLQAFYFDALHFLRVAELFDANSLFDVTLDAGIPGKGRKRSILCLRNIVPAPFLGQRFAATRSTILFSATLSPWYFYADTLGLPDATAWIDVESPFTAAQLSVRIAADISTRYRDRDDSLAPIADLIARHYRENPGNYLAFFSSFEYLQKSVELFRRRFPDIPAWEQARRMEEPERDAFLARFVPSGRGIGFAVLGGAFGEGIDLPGDRLIGAFIATLGLPQLNPVNEQIKQRMQQLFGAGYDYAYLYPGLQKVIQAAGRVIRTPEDRGTVYLIDDRFARSEVRDLLPKWWNLGPGT